MEARVLLCGLALTLSNSARLIEMQKDMSAQTQPFDWTFTTAYKGTLGNAVVEETTEEINIAKSVKVAKHF